MYIGTPLDNLFLYSNKHITGWIIGQRAQINCRDVRCLPEWKICPLVRGSTASGSLISVTQLGIHRIQVQVASQVNLLLLYSQPFNAWSKI